MNSLRRYSSVYCETPDIFIELARLNNNGWVVTSIRPTQKINEIAMEALYIGVDARKMQKKIEFIII